jgi:hypothetical protein
MTYEQDPPDDPDETPRWSTLTLVAAGITAGAIVSYAELSPVVTAVWQTIICAIVVTTLITITAVRVTWSIAQAARKHRDAIIVDLHAQVTAEADARRIAESRHTAA